MKKNYLDSIKADQPKNRTVNERLEKALLARRSPHSFKFQLGRFAKIKK